MKRATFSNARSVPSFGNFARAPAGVQCGRRIGKLTAAKRRALPDRMFGLPECRNNPSCPDFPMPDSQHAALAKGRAITSLKRRDITRSEFNRVLRKANEILRKCNGIGGRRKKRLRRK